MQEMDESVEGITVTKNSLATPGPSTDEFSEIKNQAVEGTSVIENIDDNILEKTPAPNTAGDFEMVDLTAEDIALTENLVATSGPSTEEVCRRTEVKIENGETTLRESTAGINEIMDQDAESINAIENLSATPAPSAERFREVTDQTTEDFKEIERLNVSPVSGADVFNEIMDLDEVTINKRISAAYEKFKEGINKTMDQTTEEISATQNLVFANLVFANFVCPNLDEISKAMNEITENSNVTENLKLFASETEVSTDIMDLDDVTVTESLVAAHGSNSEGINEIKDQMTEDIRVIENMETIPVPITERITETSDKIDEVFGVAEHLDAAPVSSTGVNETHVPIENAMFGMKINNNNENEAGNETSKTRNDETKNLEIVCKHKRKGLKRKIAHPSISEMVMNSIKSLNKDSGVSFEDIKTIMEENYSVNVTGLWKYHVINYLQKWAENGILEKVDETDTGERFRITEF